MAKKPHVHSDLYVHAPGTWENDTAKVIPDWYAISCEHCSIFAYAGTEEEACAIRDLFVKLPLNER